MRSDKLEAGTGFEPVITTLRVIALGQTLRPSPTGSILWLSSRCSSRGYQRGGAVKQSSLTYFQNAKLNSLFMPDDFGNGTLVLNK